MLRVAMRSNGVISLTAPRRITCSGMPDITRFFILRDSVRTRPAGGFGERGDASLHRDRLSQQA